ncbi:MAG: peptide ABC transporter permease [Candidatus Rokuibacteriota bacterium]|nr:MAG: peptide ABC transporter permease [Candidatus Rokubacteria bacterium]
MARARPSHGAGAPEPRLPHRHRGRLRHLGHLHADQPRDRPSLRLARPSGAAPAVNHLKAWLGIGLTAAVVAAAVAAPWLSPHDPLATDFAASLRPPGAPGHPLGTDQLGRDLLARVLHGARLALLIGVCTVVITAVGGGALGLVAGFVERWPAAVLMRLADVQLSFPFILLAMTINAIVGLGLRNIILSLSAAGWVVYARVVRGEVLSVKQRDFVQAAAALGMSRVRLLLRHVLPNVAPSVIVVASLQFSSFIVAEAAISFLGFGVQPPTPAWGSMLSEGRDFLYVAWWLAAFPGAALALTALGVNLLGDWLRDTLDPKLRV